MKKEVLAGLTALLTNCSSSAVHIPSPPQIVQPLPPSGYLYRDIVIQGSLKYTNTTMQALDFIFYNDPKNWPIVQNNITVIRFNPPSGIYVHNGVFETDENETTSKYSQPLEWVAGEIVHDAWHREYYRRGEAYNGWEGEKKCMERQNEFFQRIGYKQLNVEEMLKTRYWEVEPRTW